MKRRFNILYISHSPHFSGAEINLLTLVKNINKSKFVPIVAFPYHGPLVEKIQSLGIRTYIAPTERWIRYQFEKPIKNSSIYTRIRFIENIIEKEFIDIVHTNSSVVIEGAIAAKYKNVPHVWHIHEFLKAHLELSACFPLPFVYKIISYLSKNIVCVSDFTKSQFEPIVGDNKLLTIYNGVEENNSIKNDNYLRDILSIKENEIIAVMIGLLTEAKGYDILLKVASIIKEKKINTKFVWVGAATRKTLRDFNSKIKYLGLKDFVFYMGFREDIQAILKCSDLLICPSMMETLSLAILEAMASGLPVITTDCGGPTECVIDKSTGYIVPVNDSIKLSEKIIELCKDKQIMKTFGENGLKHFTENFRASVYVEKFEKLYLEILNDREKKMISLKDKMLIDSFLQVYPVISENHWKVLKKNKNTFFN